jgi:hypothetical protein
VAKASVRRASGDEAKPIARMNKIRILSNKGIYIPSDASIIDKRIRVFSNVDVDNASVERKMYGLKR